MSKACILISGPAVGKDEQLYAELQQSAEVLRNTDNSKIQAILSSRKPDLVIIEITGMGNEEMEQFRLIRSRFPGLPVILVNGSGDQEVIVSAFAGGVKDAFRKPYKRYLLAERANALLRRPSREGGSGDRRTGGSLSPGKGPAG